MRALTRPFCSGLALATALLAASAAHAQAAFQGTGTVVYGGATINQLSGTTVQVSTPQTVINWTPTDNAVAPNSPILFQPAGTTAVFTTTTGSNLTDFAVLNRILPADTSRPITLNGTILSNLQGSAAASAGTVYFYSPSGLIIGANAVINVGSLGLTTADPWNGSGDWLSGSDRTIVFQTSLPNKTINLLSGSSITTAGSSSSYTAIVAPGIVHSGTIRTSGAAALVAADGATIRFSPDNLYSIEVTAAYDDGRGLVIDGGTIGRTATGAVAANQRLYLVAIPKNDAVTMLIQGNSDLGFTPANSAVVEGNAIVLSAGRSITNGVIADGAIGLAGNVIIENASFRDRLVAATNGSMNLQAITGDLRFAGGVSIQADNVKSFIGHGHTLSVGGDLLLDVSRNGAAGEALSGGIIDLSVGDPDDPASGGRFAVTGSVELLANGTGGDAATGNGGSGSGGSISLLVHGNGTVDIGHDLLAFADGQGGSAADGGTGGQGFGGSVILRTTTPGARLTTGGTISLSASGQGGAGDGSGCESCSGQAGSAQGGFAQLSAEAGTIRANILSVDADGTGGGALNGSAGSGQGGTALVSLSGTGSIDIGPAGEGDSLTLSASGSGGDSVAGAGGSAEGGDASLTTLSGATGLLTVAGGTSVIASALGGSGAGAGGNATGGAASVSAQGGAIALTGIDVRGGGIAGDASNGLGGTGRGGFALLEAVGGGRLGVTGLASLDASGTGGSGAIGGAGIGGGTLNPTTGQWLAGGARIFAVNGSVTIAGAAQLAVDGIGGDARAGGSGGDGTGGLSLVLAENSDAGAGLVNVAGADASLVASAQGRGGAGGDLASSSTAGAGGAGQGGGVTVAGAAGNGTVVAGEVLVSVTGAGGRGGSNLGAGAGGAGGAAVGGLAQVGSVSGVAQATGSNQGGARFDSVTAIADALGGAGGTGASGGRGGGAQDGRALLLVRGSRVAIGSAAVLRADAHGGDGGVGSNGADGTGGDALIGGTGGIAVIASDRSLVPEQRGALVAGTIVASATATGGASRNAASHSLTHGGDVFQLTNADASLGSVTFLTAASATDGQTLRDLVSIDSGTANVAGSFGFTTASALALTARNGGMTAGSIGLDALTFVGEPTPSVLGTYNAGSWAVRTRGDFVTTALLRSGSDLRVDAPGLIRTFGIDAAGTAQLTAGGSLATASLSAGSDALLRSGGALITGDVGARGRVLLASAGTLNAGNVSGGGAIALLGHGNISVGSLSAPQGTILVGDDAMSASGGTLATFNWAALLAATPLTSSGTLTVSGAVQAQRLTGAVGGNASFAGAVSASELVRFASNSLLDITGQWTAPNVDLVSADLNLGTTAGLSASGLLALHSSNPAQMLIGDGLAGSGYALSNAEFGRLRGANITLTGPSDASMTNDIVIGQLTIAGSQLGANGVLHIGTQSGEVRAGVIGIVGAVAGTGFGLSQTVELEAARIELDATTGSLALTGTNGALGGLLNLRTDRFWAAESTVLARLAADPNYAGRAKDLATPTTVARPEGILRAASVQVFTPQQVLVQNTGTVALPAGVVAGSADLVGAVAGPIELIVNGQIAGSGTRLTGLNVWSAFTKDPGFHLGDFTATSSVNGCLLSVASCAPPVVPAVAIRIEDIYLGNLAFLPDRLFEGNGGKKGKGSVINPAEKLVDGKPVERLQPIDEPVSGSGNPALTAQSAAPGAAQ